ncbi:hypothetical protein B0A55_09016 [Friedmanniomyces simplex]|uniref:Uncharacterized protein n=1 Tax=Friedmanniomyces simplex TaxID=329884 RepID=A0A4U0WZR9_9PEZI|nr:hypothetical protein B0A55_09016 [Friedmanniomyces simplex]
MPTFRSVTVHVTDKNDVPLEEHGVRKSDRAKNTSCYVLSENDMPFRISIKPSVLPFPEFEREAEERRSRREKDEKGKAVEREERGYEFESRGGDVDERQKVMEDVYGKPEEFERKMGLHDIEDADLRKHVRWLAKRYGDASWEILLLQAVEFDRAFQRQALVALEDFASSYHVGPGGQQEDDGSGATKKAPYHLIATLRLDARRGWEKRSILCLDQGHPQFRAPEGETKMVYRTVRDPDGGLRQCGWYFSEVGIETVMDSLDKLLLAGDNNSNDTTTTDHDNDVVPAEDDDDLLTAFRTLGTNGLNDSEEPFGAGQIEITFERIKIGLLKRNEDFHDHAADADADDDVGKAVDAAKVPHIAARDAGIKRRGTHDVIYFEPYVPGESPFAIFRFYYRNEQRMRKMGFLGPAGEAAGTGTQQQKKAALSSMAPLSITQATLPQYDFNAEGRAIAGGDVPGTETKVAAAGGVENKMVFGGGVEVGKTAGVGKIRMVFGGGVEAVEAENAKRLAEGDLEREVEEGVKKVRKEEEEEEEDEEV